MLYFCIIVSMICLVIMSGVCTFVIFEARIITELQVSLERERMSLQDTNIGLSKAHNSVVEAQKLLADRMDTMELKMSGIATAMPQQRKY